MKAPSLTQEEFDLVHPVICYLHKGEGDKTDAFLIQKFGESTMYLTRRWLMEQPTQKEVEEERDRLIKEILKNKKYKSD